MVICRPFYNFNPRSKMTALLGKKMENKLALIASSIKSIPNYPKPGIIFRDITSLVENPSAFHAAIELIVQHVKAKGITKVIGTEARLRYLHIRRRYYIRGTIISAHTGM